MTAGSRSEQARSIEPPKDPLTELGAVELADRIRSGEVSSRQVVAAFVERVERVNGLLNALVVPLLEQALRDAAEADERQARSQRRSGSERLGPLHGVPVSIKDCFHVAGAPSTLGLVSRANQLEPRDGVLVQRLRDAGAIVLGKTNVPLLMLSHECDNPLFGRSNNPWDLERTCGGSSGGEAALIAAAASPLGLGSDMGGSLRVPAHFCGIHALKPGSWRLPRSGGVRTLRGLEAIQFQPGPMARRVEDLERMLRVMHRGYGEEPSPDVAPVGLPQSGEVDLSRLGYAVWSSDPFFPASPAIRKAVEAAGEMLGGRGARRESLTFPTAEVVESFVGLMASDGGADVRALRGSNPPDAHLRRLAAVAGMPRWLRPFAARGLEWFGQPQAARMVRVARPLSGRELWQASWRRQRLAAEFLGQMEERRVDVVLCPAFGTPAPRHGDAGDLLPAACYSYLANVLGVPCGVVALTRIAAGDQSPRPASRSWSDRAARRAEADSAGLPVGVQVFARPWREDHVLAVMAALEADARNLSTTRQEPEARAS